MSLDRIVMPSVRMSDAPVFRPGVATGAPVYVIGGVNMDISGTPAETLRPGDSNPGRVSLSPGGVGRNIAENLSRLGRRVSLITILGNDPYADVIREHCRNVGIDLSMSFTDPLGHTSTYLCLNEQNGDLHAAVSDMAICEQLTPDRLEPILPTLNRISAWIESVFVFVSGEAINNGVPVKGYKVVEGRSKRVFTDLKAVVDTAMQNGYTDLYKKELISLTEFEKLMGKKRFAELLGPYVAKPPGKLALVPDSDPRPPVENAVSPEQEFSALPAQDEE